MFDGSLPAPDALASVSDAELAEAVTGWSAAAAAAEARTLAAIAEVARRADSATLRERDAVDDVDAAAAVVSCALTVSHGKALRLIDKALLLRDRLPMTGARFLDGEISGALIAAIHERTQLVANSVLPQVDYEIARHAPSWGVLTKIELDRAIDMWIDKYDPDAVRRTRSAVRDRYMTVGSRTDVATGTVSIHGRLTAPDAAIAAQRLAAMIASVCEDDPRTVHQRRADATGAIYAGSFFLACRCDNPQCTAKIDDGRASSITIHVVAEQDSVDADPDPSMHGETPEASAPVPKPEPSQQRKAALIPALPGTIVPAPLLAELIAHGAKLRVVATDIPAEDRYRPSTALQEFIRVRDMTCRFPGCDRPAQYADIDHTEPWPNGLTHPSNLKCYCRKHHLVKTFLPGWADEQHPDGTITLTTAAGLTYTTKPLSTLLFPSWNTTAPPPSDTARPHAVATHPGRHLMMPTRRRTRAQNRAARIAAERRLNAQERARAAEPKPRAAQVITPDDYWAVTAGPQTDDEKPPPF
jgi:Domain of unknown function (DUF222)